MTYPPAIYDSESMNQHRTRDGAEQQRFRIWVAGRLGEGFSAGIGEDIEQDAIEGETRLTGPLVDQSQLHGILDHLRRLGIEVLRFESPWIEERS
jgi:hypothetical protein